ncbi:MAG: hypothetical protein OXG18_10270 [Gemmatimonadetes bacterium]|nr:hypothetical protein [Gemmatimonadota bacterium]
MKHWIRYSLFVAVAAILTVVTPASEIQRSSATSNADPLDRLRRAGGI